MTQVRYLDGRPVTTKGERFVTEKKEEWVSAGGEGGVRACMYMHGQPHISLGAAPTAGGQAAPSRIDGGKHTPLLPAPPIWMHLHPCTQDGGSKGKVYTKGKRGKGFV